MAGKTRRDRGGGARIRRARRGAGGGPDPCTEWGIRWAPIEEAGRLGVHPRSNQSVRYTHAPTCCPQGNPRETQLHHNGTNQE